MAQYNFKIEREIVKLPSKTEHHLELNVISWNGNEKKIDIRKWRENREGKPGKGICLTEEEFRTLFEAGMKYLEG